MAGVLPDKDIDGSPTSRKPRKTSVSMVFCILVEVSYGLNSLVFADKMALFLIFFIFNIRYWSVGFATTFSEFKETKYLVSCFVDILFFR